MPYITKRRQKELETRLPTTAGDLTYLVTMEVLTRPSGLQLTRSIRGQIDRYLTDRAPRFEHFCTVVGALECAAQELERRRPDNARARWQASILRITSREFYTEVVAPYEDVKCESNGDVYDVQQGADR